MTGPEAPKPAGEPRLSRSEEDYLGDIYRLQAGGEPVKTGDLAQRLGVSSASTTAMFKKLARDGYLHYKEYAGATLTGAGERAALGVIRRHRLTERFLTDLLGIPWERVDALAHRMEHALPDEVVDALEQLLGDPETCPHGYPIPAKDGQVAPGSACDLTGLATGEQARVSEVDEADPAMLLYLGEQRLVPGTCVAVTQVNPLDGTISLRFAGRDLVVGPRIAQAVRVTRIAADGGRPVE